MALLFMDSFDHYATADVLEKWSTTGATGTGASVTIAAGSGRRGSASLRWVTGTSNNGTGYVSRAVAPTTTTAIVGFSFSMSGNPAGSNGMQIAVLRDAGTTQNYLRLNADGTLSVMKGVIVLGTSSAALAVATPYFLEWKIKIENSGGTVDLRINGISVLSLSGLDTTIGPTPGWGSVVLGMVDPVGSSLLSTSRTIDYDDLYVLDSAGAAPWADVLGDCRVDVRLPTGAGATTAWTPSAAPNWSCVDDAAPNDDTDYTNSATVGHTDTFVLQDAPVPGAPIYGVQHCLNMKKLDVGACTVAPVVRHGGVDYAGTNLGPGTTYAYGLVAQATNPGTGAAWTEADFNAAEFGYRKTG